MFKKLIANKKILLIIFLAVLSIFTRFFILGRPAEVIFDEVHFGSFVNDYLAHEYFFDIHPPLGKLIIAASAKLSGYEPTAGFGSIGDRIERKSLFILRFMPAFFGAGFVILIYLFIISMGLSRQAAFLGAWMVLFDNSLLLISRYISIDNFMLFFGFSSLLFFIKSRKAIPHRKSLLFFLLSVVFASMALSVKLTGLSFLGVIILFFIIDTARDLRPKILIRNTLILVIVPALIYTLLFWMHFGILYKSGSGNAFMSDSFQKTLEDNQITADVPASGFFSKFRELNITMNRENASITAEHDFSSKWHQWVLGHKAILCWTKHNGRNIAEILIIPNYIVWYAVLAGILAGLIMLTVYCLTEKNDLWLVILMFGYLANVFPFILISRPSFIYHYFPALTFGIIIFAYMYDKLLPHLRGIPASKSLYYGFLFIIVVLFVILSPISYGFFTSAGINNIYRHIAGVF